MTDEETVRLVDVLALLRRHYASPSDPEANDYGMQGRQAADLIEREYSEGRLADMVFGSTKPKTI